MHLLGDVRFIEIEKNGPTHCWHERALELTKPASLKSVSMETTTVVVHESMVGSHHCQKTVAK